MNHTMLLTAPYLELMKERNSGDRFNANLKIHMACFIELLDALRVNHFFGDKDSLHLVGFVLHIIEYLKPYEKNEWMPPSKLLDRAYRNLYQSNGRLISQESHVSITDPQSCVHRAGDFMLLLSGYNEDRKNWMKIISLLTLSQIVIQALFLHMPAITNMTENQDSDTWVSDVFLGLAVLLILFRVAESFGAFMKLFSHQASHVILGGCIASLAVSLQVASQIELEKDSNSSYAAQQAILSNSLLAGCLAGSPLKFSSWLANQPFFLAPLGFPFVLTYGLGLKLWECHTKEESDRVRKHIVYVINRLLFVLSLVGSVALTCLFVLSLSENIIGQLFGKKYGEDIALLGISLAHMMPCIIYLMMMAQSQTWVKSSIKKPRDCAIDSIKSVSMVVSLAMCVLCCIVQSLWLSYQHSSDPNITALTSGNGSLTLEREKIEYSALAVGIFSFCLFASCQSWKDRKTDPRLKAHSTLLKPLLLCLNGQSSNQPDGHPLTEPLVTQC